MSTFITKALFLFCLLTSIILAMHGNNMASADHCAIDSVSRPLACLKFSPGT